MSGTITEEILKNFLDGLQSNIKEDTESIIKKELEGLTTSIKQNTKDIDFVKKECAQLKE